jgi:class 3 adenylate cyclase/tetratricopeptide (TPR) repeat protein
MAVDTLACWSCGFENPAGARFCAGCGKPQRAACPECGTPAPEGARFCSNCGIALGKPSPPAGGAVLTAEARKVVTIVFADLVGSTGLTERLDPEEAREVAGKFYHVVQGAVERYGGAIANLLGDAVLAVFGLPVAHEDDPERAVRAGMAIREAMGGLNEHLETAHRVRLAVRVGIDTGEVVAASGSTFDRDFLVSDAVTSAARLQQSVSPGTVVVGERTYRLTRHAIEYTALPPLEVKGKAEALAVWQAVAPLPDRADVRRVTAALVGRHGELGILRYLYSRSRDERVAQLVTIFGQPGVGKSRLVREFLAEARDGQPAPVVLRGRSVGFGEHIGYQALIDILRAQAGLMDNDAPHMVRGKLAAWLAAEAGGAEILDGLLLAFGGADGPGPDDPGARRRELFAAWTGLLSRLASRGPVVLTLEDLHWADDGLLDLVEWLADHLTDTPLFVVCLARPELLERRPAWGGGRRNVSTIDLLPLRTAEAEQLVASLSSQGLSAEVSRVVAQRAEGNPLFVEELVRMLLEGGGPGSSIPDTVQAVLTARIDRLPTVERRVLQAASVFGRTFWPAAVAPLVGVSAEEATSAIEALVGKDLVVRRQQSTIAGAQEFAFRHILTHDVAYSMLPRAQRQRAHLEAAQWLEGRLGERVEDAVEILAEHLRVGGDDARAAGYLLRAAAKARRLYANADAIRLYTQADEAARRAGLPAAEVATIRLGRGDVHQLVGNYAPALADFEAALDALRAADDRGLAARAESGIGLIYHRQMVLDEAEAHFERAAVLAREARDPRALGRVLVDLANVAWDRGRMMPDHRSLAEGIGLLRDAGDDAGLARALNLLCMAHFSSGNAGPSLAAASDALAAARRAGDRSREATSLSYMAIVEGFKGDYHDAEAHAAAALTIARQIGERRREAFTLAVAGQLRGSVGAWGEALALFEESLPLLRQYFRLHLPFAILYLTMLHDEIGDSQRAVPLLEEAAAAPTNHPSWEMITLGAMALLAAHRRDDPTVHRALDRLQAMPWGVFLPDDTELILPVGEALLAAGRHEELRAFLAARAPQVEQFDSAPQRAAYHLVLGQLEALAGRRDGAVAAADTALALSRRCGAVIPMRRALELRWTLLADHADREALRALLARLAASLPDDLRRVFLQSARVAPFAPLPPSSPAEEKP